VDSQRLTAWTHRLTAWVGIEIERGVGEITCWVAVGMEDDDIPHAVAADDGVDVDGGANEEVRARGSPHSVAVAWLRTGRRRRHSQIPTCGGGGMAPDQ
jgi:hypothetical protein